MPGSPPSTPIRNHVQVGSHPPGNGNSKIRTAKESGNYVAATPSRRDVDSDSHTSHRSHLTTPPTTPRKRRPQRKNVDFLEESEQAQLSTPSSPTKPNSTQGPPSVNEEKEKVGNIFQMGAKRKRKSAVGAQVKVKSEPATLGISMKSKFDSKSSNAKPIALLTSQTTLSRSSRTESTAADSKKPRKSTTAPNSISANIDTAAALSRIINARSTSTRAVGLCPEDSYPVWDEKDGECPRESFHETPKDLPAFVSWACVGLFAKGRAPRYFQPEDLLLR